MTVVGSRKTSPAFRSPSSNESLDALARDVDRKLDTLAKQQTKYSLLQLDVLYAAPDRPRQGMLAYADGANWNPGDGEGVYEYTSSGWKILRVASLASAAANRAVKSTDQSQTSNTTFTDDSVLQFAVLATTKYWFEFSIQYDTPTAADFKWQLIGPASPTLILYDGFALPPGATAETITRDNAFTSPHSLTETSGTPGFVRVRGILQNGANAGTVKLQWAQNTSNASATKVYAGSKVEWGIAA